MSVLLRKPLFEGISQAGLAEQLEAKKKCGKKLPTWFNTPKIYYPNKLNIEQSSSEKTAEYKSWLINGKSLLDMTGGFGVDSFYFSKKMEAITHLELDENLSEIVAHNFKILGVANCDIVIGDGIDFLKGQDQKFDWIYADPSRRDATKGKVFRLADCTPNIPENLELLFEHTDAVLLKASPLLDLTLAINELKYVTEIHVVAVQNEVKELLFLLEKDSETPLKVKTINLKKNADEHFEFLWNEEKEAVTEYGLQEKYLYEPNAAILKSGGFNSIGNTFYLKKLAPHSHVYTSEKQVDFPGRIFKIGEVLPYNKRTMKQFTGSKVNVTTRNFPETVATIRKKYKLKDGGDSYLFFTTDSLSNRLVMQCKKL